MSLILERQAPHEWRADIACAIYRYCDLRKDYPWAVGKTARERLARIFPEIAATVFRDTDNLRLNHRLREALASHLQGRHAVALAAWIIREWGGIRAIRDTTIHTWMDSLADFCPDNVNALIREQCVGSNWRISSWSKLLAFADHARYAIYDARTAVALNCALAIHGDHRRFYMPLGRNRSISTARQQLTFDPRLKAQSLGYEQYLSLLKTFVSVGCAHTVLDAEMVLFANAPAIANAFLRRQTGKASFALTHA